MKSRTYHTRVIVLHYDSTNVPIFKTAEEWHDWERVLGRLVTYGLQGEGEGEDGAQLVNMAFGMNPTEVHAAYYPPAPVPRDEEGFAIYQGSPEQAVKELRDRLYAGTPFVIGAVLHEDHEWGFHS